MRVRHFPLFWTLLFRTSSSLGHYSFRNNSRHVLCATSQLCSEHSLLYFGLSFCIQDLNVHLNWKDYLQSTAVEHSDIKSINKWVCTYRLSFFIRANRLTQMCRGLHAIPTQQTELPQMLRGTYFDLSAAALSCCQPRAQEWWISEKAYHTTFFFF